MVVFSRVLSSVSSDAFLFTNTACVLLGTKYPGFSDATWLPDKNKEESQTSTSAGHILGGPSRAGLSLRLQAVNGPFCLAQGSEAAGQGVLAGRAVFLFGGLRAWHCSAPR